MNIKNNKGFAATDISIAVLILLILVPTIMGIVFNLNNSKNELGIKSEAINIASNIVEELKGIKISELTSGNISTELTTKSIYTGKITTSEGSAEENYTGKEYTGEEYNGVITTDKASYKLIIKVVDYDEIVNHGKSEEEKEDIARDIVKRIFVSVYYKYGEKKKFVELSTVVK